MVMNYGGGMFPQQRSPYDSMFAPRPDMTGPTGPMGSQGNGFGMPPGMSAPMPGTQGLLGPQGMGGGGGFMPAAQQQQGQGVLNLTPQMIQQIMQQMAQQRQPQGAQQMPPGGLGGGGPSLDQIQQAQRMMGIGGQMGPR